MKSIYLLLVFLFIQFLCFSQNLNQAYYNIGISNFERKEYEKAIQNFELALKESPDDIESINGIGISYYRLINTPRLFFT